MYRRKSDILKPLVAAVLFLFVTTSARAANFADYFPLTLGSWWKYEIFVPVVIDDAIVMQSTGRFETRSVFEVFWQDGELLMKFGESVEDYDVLSNNGTALTLYRHAETTYEPLLSLGNVTDGSMIPTNLSPILFQGIQQNSFESMAGRHISGAIPAAIILHEHARSYFFSGLRRQIPEKRI